MNSLCIHYGPEVYCVAEKGFTMVCSGMRGSGKSITMENIAASCIAGKSIGSWFFDGGKKKVSVEDTELPESLVDKFVRRVQLYSGLDEKVFKEKFNHYNYVDIVEFSERREKLFERLESADCDLLILDNLTGFCSDTDVDGARELFNKVNAFCKRTGCIAIAVCHKNKEGFARGWAGRLFSEQGSAELSIVRDYQDGWSTITSPKCRLDNIPPIDFTVDPTSGLILPGPYMPFPKTWSYV